MGKILYIFMLQDSFAGRETGEYFRMWMPATGKKHSTWILWNLYPATYHKNGITLIQEVFSKSKWQSTMGMLLQFTLECQSQYGKVIPSQKKDSELSFKCPMYKPFPLHDWAKTMTFDWEYTIGYNTIIWNVVTKEFLLLGCICLGKQWEIAPSRVKSNH